jgi:hypothetical protein
MKKNITLLLILLIFIIACSKTEPFSGNIKDFAPRVKIGETNLTVDYENDEVPQEMLSKYSINIIHKYRIKYTFNNEIVYLEQLIMKCKNVNKCINLIEEESKDSINSQIIVNGFSIDLYENRYGTYNLALIHKDVLMTLSGINNIESVMIVLEDITQRINDIETFNKLTENL